VCDNRRVADADDARPLVSPIAPLKIASAKQVDKTLCDRRGAEMYRMHAVWRCPSCGFKTDCCGW
jgi:hypothetical protein